MGNVNYFALIGISRKAFCPTSVCSVLLPFFFFEVKFHVAYVALEKLTMEPRVTLNA